MHLTNLSLHQASAEISSKVSRPDAQLFLIKHLLLLKQQIVAFDIEFVSPEVSVDFSGVTSTFWELRERGGLFNPRNLMQLVGRGLLPRVVENMLDAKVELDGRLRTVINDFTNSFAAKMTASLPPASSFSSSKYTSASLQKTRDAIGTICGDIEKEVPNLRRLLNEYLDDTRTKETLVGAVQDTVIQLYEDFYDAYTSAETGRDKLAKKHGKGAADTVWDIETFSEWTEGIFRPGIASFESSRDDDDEEGSVSST